MSERLIIRLGSQQQYAISWLLFSDKEGEVVASGCLKNAQELTQLTQHAKNNVVEVLIPGQDVSYFEVELPKVNRRQALAAIPFMLEDDLGSDVETLHFVYPKSEGQQQGVYVCSKDKISQWLTWLSDASISTNLMVPDYLALPVAGENHLSLLQLQHEVVLRHGANKGQTVDISWLPMVLQQLSMSDEESLTIDDYGIEQRLSVENIEWQEQTLLLPMQQLALGIKQSKINLLIEDFAQNKQRNSDFSIWRKVMCVAAFALILILGERFYQVHQLEQQRLALKKSSETIYRQLNPNVVHIVGLKKRMQEQLTSLSGGQGDGLLLDMLGMLNSAFDQVPSVKPQNIKFDLRRRELRLQANGEDYQQFDQFKKILSTKYSVTTGAMNNNGNEVSGSFTIKVKQ